jgi:hypothetical protein
MIHTSTSMTCTCTQNSTTNHLQRRMEKCQGTWHGRLHLGLHAREITTYTTLTHTCAPHTHTSACTFRGRKTARARGAVASMWARTWYSSLCMGMTFSLRVMPMSRQKALIAAAETPRRLKPEEWCAYLCVRVSTCVCICLQGGCLLSACAGVYRLLPDSPFPPGKIYIFQNIAPPSPRKKIYFTGTASLFSRASFQLIIEIGIRVLAPGQTQLLMQA